MALRLVAVDLQNEANFNAWLVPLDLCALDRAAGHALFLQESLPEI
ncbi:MAG: hypothetical protein HZT41_17995 [Dechloromonas sp.]|jgi:hypothetical protein|nr:MAG: hypothetical protein HZT41_17995 [Dechloromonas sp.]